MLGTTTSRESQCSDAATQCYLHSVKSVKAAAPRQQRRHVHYKNDFFTEQSPTKTALGLSHSEPPCSTRNSNNVRFLVLHSHGQRSPARHSGHFTTLDRSNPSSRLLSSLYTTTTTTLRETHTPEEQVSHRSTPSTAQNTAQRTPPHRQAHCSRQRHTETPSDFLFFPVLSSHIPFSPVDTITPHTRSLHKHTGHTVHHWASGASTYNAYHPGKCCGDQKSRSKKLTKSQKISKSQTRLC